MRLDAQDRILSLSFERDAKEHAALMLAAGRRLMRPRRAIPVWTTLVGSIVFGVAVGLAMEGYRLFVLGPLFGVGRVEPLNIVLVQLLPLVLLLIAALYGVAAYGYRRRRQALAERLEPRQFIDIDIFRDGLRSSSGPVTVALEWRGVRGVLIAKDCIEFEGEAFVSYIPERAFRSRQEFEAAAMQVQALWRDARRKASPIAPEHAPSDKVESRDMP